MDEDDAFGSLIRSCQPTSSQEDVLRTCPFARESDVFPDDNDESQSSDNSGIPVDPTGIVMVSPPASSREEEEEEEFQTPLEDSLPANSEEQRPPAAAAVDSRAGPKFDGTDDGEAAAVDEGCTDAEKTVDLGNDSDNLGFSGVKSTQMIGSSRRVDGVVNCDVFEREFEELEKFMLLARESSLASDRKDRTSGNEPVITETKRHEKASTEVLDTEVEEIGENLGADTVTDELPLKETEIGEALDKGDEVVAGVGGRRELPPSITGQAKNAGGEAGPGNLAAKNQILKDLLDALKMVAGEVVDGGGAEEEGVDFLETAKRRCLTFPRPRWWPPEGYED